MTTNSNIYQKYIDKIIQIVNDIIHNKEETISFQEAYRSVYIIVKTYKKSEELTIALNNVFEINKDKLTDEKHKKINDVLMYLIRSTNYQYLYNYDVSAKENIEEDEFNDNDIHIKIFI